jgi:hypothetical protein
MRHLIGHLGSGPTDGKLPRSRLNASDTPVAIDSPTLSPASRRMADFQGTHTPHEFLAAVNSPGCHAPLDDLWRRRLRADEPWSIVTTLPTEENPSDRGWSHWPLIRENVAGRTLGIERGRGECPDRS